MNRTSQRLLWQEDWRDHIEKHRESCTYCGGSRRPENCWACESLHPGPRRDERLTAPWSLGR